MSIFITHLVCTDKKNQKSSCVFCTESFPDNVKLSNHVKEKHNMTTWNCHLCEATFMKKELLCRHMIKSHNMIDPKECEICKIWLSEAAMSYHNDITHKKTSYHNGNTHKTLDSDNWGTTDKTTLNEGKNDEIQHQCTKCEKNFKHHTGDKFSEIISFSF